MEYQCELEILDDFWNCLANFEKHLLEWSNQVNIKKSSLIDNSDLIEESYSASADDILVDNHTKSKRVSKRLGLQTGFSEKL